MVPASVLKHANAFMRLFEDSAGIHGARDCPRCAESISSVCRRRCSRRSWTILCTALLLAYARPRRWCCVSQEPGRPAVLQIFRREHVAIRHLGIGGELGSLLDHTGPIAEGERNAARIFGADETLFVVGGTSTANKIVWHGMVGQGDLVLCDRNCHKSILHSLIMTGATPIYLMPSRNGLGIIGPISKDQFTPQVYRTKDRCQPVRQGDERAKCG